MVLDGFFGQVQALADLAVGQPLAEEFEHARLARRQRRHGIGYARTREFGQQFGGERGRDIGLAVGDAAGDRPQFAGGNPLQHIAMGAGLERRQQAFLVFRNREHHDAHPRLAGGDLSSRGNAAHAGHGHVHQHHVRAQPLRQFHRFLAAAGRGDDFEIRVRRQRMGDAFAKQRVVVGEQDADRARHGAPRWLTGAGGRGCRCRGRGPSPPRTCRPAGGCARA